MLRFAYRARKVESFEISFETPTRGWLPVEIELGGEHCSFSVSNLLNDPIHELAAAARLLAQGPNRVAINWWLEPDWHILGFDSTANESSTQIALYLFAENDQLSYFDDDWNNSAQSVCRSVVPTVDLCRHIAARLRSLFHSCGHSVFESAENWNRPFPDATIDEIYSVLRSGDAVD